MTFHDSMAMRAEDPRIGQGGHAAGRAGLRPNWPAVALVVLVHAALLFVALHLGIIPVVRQAPPPLVIELVTRPPDPPPNADVEPKPERVTPQPIAVPRPVVVLDEVTPPPVATTAEPPPPPRTVLVEAPAPQPSPAPAGPIALPDLNARVLSMVNPRIPFESRRRRESGTVYILVTLALDGSVEQASLSRSCGFPRLDQAVLEAVRRWRWSPTMRDGERVRVRGIVNVSIAPAG